MEGFHGTRSSSFRINIIRMIKAAHFTCTQCNQLDFIHWVCNNVEHLSYCNCELFSNLFIY